MNIQLFYSQPFDGRRKSHRTAVFFLFPLTATPPSANCELRTAPSDKKDRAALMLPFFSNVGEAPRPLTGPVADTCLGDIVIAKKGHITYI